MQQLANKWQNLADAFPSRFPLSHWISLAPRDIRFLVDFPFMFTTSTSRRRLTQSGVTEEFHPPKIFILATSHWYLMRPEIPKNMPLVSVVYIFLLDFQCFYIIFKMNTFLRFFLKQFHSGNFPLVSDVSRNSEKDATGICRLHFFCSIFQFFI